jgi:hypothetical protein
MAISVDEVTKLISILQSDLTFVSATEYILDTEWLRDQLKIWESSTEGGWRERTHLRNPPFTTGSITVAQGIEIINGYTIEFEDTGSPYRVFLEGSNNNILDVAVLNGNVSIASQNSAGLQIVVQGSGVTQQDKDDIENQIFARVVESTYSFEQMIRLIAAAAAGDIEQATDGTYTIRGIDGVTARILGELAANNGRDVTSLDGS